jgi:biotin carboxyl carrier protein
MKKDSQDSKKSVVEKTEKVSKSEYVTMNITGDEYDTLLTKKYKMRTKWEKPNAKYVVSFIPGTVIEILIKEGQTLKKGDKIMILEAMKMYNSIELPLDGKIKKIHVQVGDRIPKGRLMIELA